MPLTTEPYLQSVQRLPTAGNHLLAHQDADTLVVYQAYNSRIADYAVQHQTLGGADFSYVRMSWIKPNFLWMMYRCGWASKPDQERVLAMHLPKNSFDEILRDAVFSSFSPQREQSQEQWKRSLGQHDVRLQWDPDHNPFGEKLARRAIQLGLRGKTLERFGKEWLVGIEDITEFVREQRQWVERRQLENLRVPVEHAHRPADESLASRLGLNE